MQTIKMPANLTPGDERAFINVKKSEELALKKCIEFTGGNTLTEIEYQAASVDFQELIDAPRKKSEAIYIMPEFDIDGGLHPKLQLFCNNIMSNVPYHLFIEDGYGTAWPILLRLYYGLSSGFKISIEQMDSMLAICYWRETGLRIQSFLIFNEDCVLL